MEPDSVLGRRPEFEVRREWQLLLLLRAGRSMIAH
jgi:hypothetical protein